MVIRYHPRNARPDIYSINNGGLISWELKKKARELLSKERGTVYKDPGGRLRVCLVYPNAYSVGMANLGFQSVYRLINDKDYALCERAFLPEKEDINEFLRGSTPLFSLETQTPVKEFDIVAFSVSFEEDYINIPTILSLSGVPVFSRERKHVAPLILAGGVAVSINPEPLSDIADLFLIGEGEGALGEFLDLYRKIHEGGGAKRDALFEMDSLPFVYVPSLYEFTYEGVRVKEIRPQRGAKERVIASKSKDLGAYPLPESFITTPLAEFGGASLVEIERGCGRGCRFCAAGFIYLPPRMRTTEAVKAAVRRGVENTGKAGLVGAAVSEHPDIKSIVEAGMEASMEGGGRGEITLSSLRLDRLDRTFLELLKKAGYRTVTLAPEAGSPRMRDIVNKGIDEDGILSTVALVKEAGFERIKLYFIIGLPWETDEDAEAVAELSVRIKGIMQKGELTLSVNPFIPKPFTPFQWCSFTDIETIEKRLSIIKKRLLKARGIRMNSMPATDAFVQAFISRSDRRAGALINGASQKGWRRTVRAERDFMEESVFREREKDEVLPWDLIDHRIKKDYLWKEYKRGERELLTPPCDVGRCLRCGVC